MRSLFTYLLFIIMCTGVNLFAQDAPTSDSAQSDTTDVQTSGGERSERTMVVPDDFLNVWPRIPRDLQDKMLTQVGLILEKDFHGKKMVVDYFKVVAAAKDIEGLDDRKLTAYLNMTGKALEVYDKSEISHYLRSMQQFFEYKSLFYARSNKLYANEAEYNFEFVAAPVIEEEVQEVLEEEPIEEDLEDEEWFHTRSLWCLTVGWKQ